MANFVQGNALFSTILNADVLTSSGSFTIAYPAGFNQGSFTTGQVNTAKTYMIVNGNDRYDTTKWSVVYGASNVTVTNLTGKTLSAGSSVLVNIAAANTGPSYILNVPVNLVSIGGNVDVVTAMSPGVDGVVEYAEFVVTTPVTTASKLATLNLYINAVAITGGTIALTSANATPLGKVVAVTGITALNAITGKDTFSVKATGVTAFAEGSGVLCVRFRLANPNAY